ncbi:MAG: ATP-binding protein [Shimia sp.]
MAIQNVSEAVKRLLDNHKESEWLELKQNNDDPDRIGRYVSALSNSALLFDRDDAFMIFGVSDEDGEVVGTTVRLQRKKVGNEDFRNWLARKLKPHAEVEFYSTCIDGKHVELLRVCACYERPLLFENEAYVRSGDVLKKLRDLPERERALWLATGRRRYEHAVASQNESLDSVVASLEIPTFYSLLDQPVPANRAMVADKLIHYGCIKDNLDGTFDVTNLGAVALATSLTSFPQLAHKRTRVVRYLGVNKMRADPNEFLSDKGYAVGFSELLTAVMQRLPTQEVYQNGVRKVVPTLPETTVRELLSNALVHQDFTLSGSSPLIEIYDDRLEISNPGRSLLHQQDLIIDRKSRNEQLADFLRDLGICELRGGGIDKAILELEARRLPSLEFLLSETSTTVVVFGPRAFAELTKADKLRALSHHCILRWLMKSPMGNASLRERFGLADDDYQQVSSLIGEAIKLGIIAPADPNQGKRNAKYIPANIIRS